MYDIAILATIALITTVSPAMVQENLTRTMDVDGENKTQHVMTEGNPTLMINDNMTSVASGISNWEK